MARQRAGITKRYRTLRDSVIERSSLPPVLADVKRTGEHSGPMVQTLADAERKTHYKTLYDTDWVIGGPTGRLYG